MRRLVPSLLAASSVAFLTACGQGGSAFNFGGSSAADRVVVFSSGNPAGVLKVVPGGTIVLSAQALTGSNNVVVQDTNFTFNYTISAVDTPYGNSQSGNQAFCNTLGGTSGVLPGALQAPGMTTLGTSVSAGSGTVVLVAPASIAAFGAASIITATKLLPSTAGAYCLTVNAMHVVDGQVGSQTILVTSGT